MFQVLALGCQNAAFCAPDGVDESVAYRTTPASGDPYKYIRSGSYKTILCKMGGMDSMISCAKPKKDQDFFHQE
jgi:hypothetical protein